MHAQKGTYIGPIYHLWGPNGFSQCTRYQDCDSAAHEGLQYQWRIQDLKKGGGGARGFAYILANLGDFLKNLEKIRGGGRLLPLSILDFTNLCADLGLEVGLADLLCPSGGGGGSESTQRTPSAYAMVYTRRFQRCKILQTARI